MFTFTTAELRWFIHTNIPEDLLDWLRSMNGHYEEQSTRTDTYLLNRNNKTLGIKFREGRFEIKSRIMKPETIDVAENVNGELEIWKKWSLSVENLDDQLSSSSEWINVNKTRYLQKFEISPENNLSKANPGFFPVLGSNVELTLIDCPSWKGFTLGVEAFGEPGKITDSLQLTISKLFSSFRWEVLHGIQSMGYPEWLLNSVE
jgi:hypothetical protein